MILSNASFGLVYPLGTNSNPGQLEKFPTSEYPVAPAIGTELSSSVMHTVSRHQERPTIFTAVSIPCSATGQAFDIGEPDPAQRGCQTCVGSVSCNQVQTQVFCCPTAPAIYLVPRDCNLCPRRLADLLLDFFTDGRPILKHSFGRLTGSERNQRVG